MIDSFNFNDAVRIEACNGIFGFEHLHSNAVGVRCLGGDPDYEIDVLVIGLMHHFAYCEMAFLQVGDIVEVAGTAQRLAPSAWLPRETVVLVNPRVFRRVHRAHQI